MMAILTPKIKLCSLPLSLIARRIKVKKKLKCETSFGLSVRQRQLDHSTNMRIRI